jgi:Domain of unknown function (DUF6378)
MNVNANIAPDKLSVSEEVLLDAATAVRTRNIEHGHTLRSFTMMAELWSIYVKHAYTIRGDMSLRADDVAQMQSLVKLTRSVYGESGDNYVDEAGYAALSAMLRPDAIEKWNADRKREQVKPSFVLDPKLPPVSPLDTPQPEYPQPKIAAPKKG